jgi:seryl-tRNA synthetase
VLDLKFIREFPEHVAAGAAKKHFTCDIDRILELDKELRSLGQEVDSIRSAQRQAGKAIAQASNEERPALLVQQKAEKEKLKVSEARQSELQEEIDRLLLDVPNPPAPEVPEGKDDAENVELSHFGEPTTFTFEPLSHIEIGERQGWLDIERGARIAGSRNYILLGDLSLLEGAVMRYALDTMVDKGFTPISVPTLVRSSVMVGTGYFPGGEDQAYRCDDRDDLVLVGTAEVPVTAYRQDEILTLEELPLRYVALSSCYRREAGAAGRDTKGLYRVHQFQKVEQVVIDRNDEALSIENHHEILGNSEGIMQSLELPYRVVDVCGGDLGKPAIQKFDIETWMPSRENYGETHSASRFHEYQSRRLKLRYRDEDKKVRYCHTLNNTVAASTRMLIAIMENHQQADGTVRVPEPLKPYLRGREFLGKPIR